MLPTSNPDRIDIAFDDDRLVDHAGLLLPATLAGRLGLRELADAHLDLGDAPGRANAGDKLLTLVASAHPRRCASRRLGCTEGAVHRCWGHVLRLHDRTTPAELHHPLLAVAAGTGEMARLREGRANTTRGAAHFLRETVARVRDAGASGQLTMRADSGFYNHAVVAACRALDVRFSVTIRQQPNVRTLIEAIRGHVAVDGRLGSSCGASSRRRAHSWRSSWTLPRLHHRRRGRRWSSTDHLGDRERGDLSTASGSPSALGPLRRQRSPRGAGDPHTARWTARLCSSTLQISGTTTRTRSLAPA